VPPAAGVGPPARPLARPAASATDFAGEGVPPPGPPESARSVVDGKAAVTGATGSEAAIDGATATAGFAASGAATFFAAALLAPPRGELLAAVFLAVAFRPGDLAAFRAVRPDRAPAAVRPPAALAAAGTWPVGVTPEPASP